jgi:hypothetical protein
MNYVSFISTPHPVPLVDKNLKCRLGNLHSGTPGWGWSSSPDLPRTYKGLFLSSGLTLPLSLVPSLCKQLYSLPASFTPLMTSVSCLFFPLG